MDELTRRMFKVLDIPESAQIQEIEAKYRQLVRGCQAAQSSGDLAAREEAWMNLKEVSSAYEIVKKYRTDKNGLGQDRSAYLRPDSAAAGIVVRKKRSAASVAIVIGLVCIAIAYHGYGFINKHSARVPARVVQGELRLFMTPR
jgi:hypothetical protein